jgi:hypothetical protein
MAYTSLSIQRCKTTGTKLERYDKLKMLVSQMYGAVAAMASIGEELSYDAYDSFVSEVVTIMNIPDGDDNMVRKYIYQKYDRIEDDLVLFLGIYNIIKKDGKSCPIELYNDLIDKINLIIDKKEDYE